MSYASRTIPDHIFEQTVLEFLAPIRKHLEDPGCSEILINGHDTVYVERKGQLEPSEAKFASPEALEAAVRNIAQFVGKTVGASRPVLEARLPDGSRIEALLPPVARGGICMAIRRFAKETLTIGRLVELGAVTEDFIEVLQMAVLLKHNILVFGGSGSGKTSLLNAISSFIPPAERVVVIEDASELKLQQPHVVYLESRPPNTKGEGEVTMRDLLRATLRLRPDRIVLGEVRSGEALDLIQAMTSGHGGCLSSVHASHPQDALRRLETLCLMSDVELPLVALRGQIGSALNFLVEVQRLNDGTRKVTRLTQCLGHVSDGHYELADLLVFHHRGKEAKTGRVLGALEPTGQASSFAEEIRARGHDVPACLVHKKPRGGA